MEKEIVREADRKKMNLNRDIQEFWPFIVAGLIFLVLKFLPNVNINLLIISYLLLAATVTYYGFKSAKRMHLNGAKFMGYALKLYATGVLSYLWINEALDLLATVY